MKTNRTATEIIPILAFILFTLLGQEVSAESSAHITDVIEMENLVRGMAIESIEKEHGKIEPHIVERGETLEFLAARSGVEVWELECLNPNLTELATGMEILIPVFPERSFRYENRLVSSNPMYSEAESLIKAEAWKKAGKVLDQILKTEDTLTGYYMRGITNYNSGKFKKAGEDFTHVAALDTYSLYPDATDMAQQSYQAWERKKEERGQLWGQIFQGIAQAGLVALNTYAQVKQAENFSKSSSGGSSTPGGDYQNVYQALMFKTINDVQRQEQDYRNVYQALMVKTVNDVQRQELEEYEMFRQNSLRWSGEDISLEEFRMLKAQAMAMSQYEDSGSYDTPSTTTSNSGSNNSYFDKYGDKQCHICHGRGICPTCNGHGVYTSGSGFSAECPNCLIEGGRRTGKCSRCQGRGTVYGIR